MNNELKENNIPIYSMGLKCQLYRIVVPFENMDTTDLLHFGYRQDVENIKRRRFNKPHEQVLYTSSYPTIAERETLEEGPKEFYLVKFRKTGDYMFGTFVAIDEHCSEDLKSDSRKAREAIKKHFSKEELKRIDELRHILEKDYTSRPEEEEYKDSSEYASEILESADCILTYSRADDGKDNIPQGQESNRFLNVTFNKLATDEHLKIETIYHCKPKEDQYCLRYEILEIGIPNEQYTRIEWFEWNVKLESVVIGDDVEIDNITLKEIIPTLMPNVCEEVHGKHIDVVSLPTFGNIHVHFNITLHRKKINYNAPFVV